MRFHSFLQGALPVTLFGSLAASAPASSDGAGSPAVPRGSNAGGSPICEVGSYHGGSLSSYSLTGHSGGSAGHYTRGKSCNTPKNRACWSTGFNIDSNYEQSCPYTGVTRKYKFVITEHDNYVGADGVTRKKAMLINGQFPGPTVYADWGDMVEIEVVSKLQTNGTGIHWHGVRQLNNNIHDGAPGITECPIAPGHSKTYSFHVTQYGTSWYHTHFSAQYGYGVTGPIVFNGPASANYDIDLGPFPLSDWYYEGIDDLLHGVTDPAHPFIPGLPGSPPPSDNVFFNGTNINPAGAGGKYAEVTLTPGKTHRLRLINPSVDNTYTVSIVGHSMTIIETDFVPVKPVKVDSVYIAVGQRYDVLIEASEKPGNYWINATYSSTLTCGSSKNPSPAAILHYKGAPAGLPTDKGTAPTDSLCQDKTDFTPIVANKAPIANLNPTSDSLSVTFDVEKNISKVFWKVNGSAINVQWDKPVLEYVQEHKTSFPSSENIISLPQANKWAFWIIQNVSPIPHPIHLHGHDYLVLGHSPPLQDPLSNSSVPRPFNPSTDTATLNTNNPTRRDSTMLPSFGWVAIAFETDNPGAWLMHCHIAWHVSQGLSVDFLEQAANIPKSMDLSVLNGNCATWSSYFPKHDPFKQYDSGL